MHAQAFDWIKKHAPADAARVLDLGGRDINGSARLAFPFAVVYTVLDIAPGDGVDIVADAASWDTGGERWACVVSSETFEHTAYWPAICRTAYTALEDGGRFIVTTAAPGRPPHSGIDGGWVLHDGEHYANIQPHRLEVVLRAVGFVDITVDVQQFPADVRAVATKPKG